MLIGKENYKVGMTVYATPYGNYARNRNKDEISEFTVTKVSNKYASLQQDGRNVGEKCTMSLGKIEGFNAGYMIYGSIQEIEDEKEAEKLKFKIRKHFEWTNNIKLTLEQLRKINSIIEE